MPEFKKILKPLIRFRLRTLLIVMTVCCIALPIWGQIDFEEHEVLIGSYHVVISEPANSVLIVNCEVCVATQFSKLLERRLKNQKAAVDQCVEKTLKSFAYKKARGKDMLTLNVGKLTQTLHDNLNDSIGSVFLGNKLVGEVYFSNFSYKSSGPKIVDEE